MEFLNSDPNVVRVPPGETRLLALRAEPFSDGKRLKVILELTPFQQKPYLEITLTNDAGEVVSSASIVEPVAWMMEIILHLRNQISSAICLCKLSAVLTYPDLGEVDRRDLTIEISSPAV